MTDMVAWLLERIDEDEAAAQRCPGTDFAIAEYPSRPGLFEVEAYAPGSLDQFDDVVVADGGARGIPEPYAQHVERWDPKRALAECEVKRRILQRHTPRVAKEGPYEGELICGCSLGQDEFYATAWPCDDVRDVSTVYAGHEGYPKCGATAIFWPDDEGCDAECALPAWHQPENIHEDAVLGEWNADELITRRP